MLKGNRLRDIMIGRILCIAAIVIFGSSIARSDDQQAIRQTLPDTARTGWVSPFDLDSRTG
jgi:hypothetical protein